jgi:hypothetical protein
MRSRTKVMAILRVLMLIVPLVFSTIGTPGAAAHRKSLTQGWSVGWISEDHGTITVCDMEDDGHNVLEVSYPTDTGTCVEREWDSIDPGCDSQRLDFRGWTHFRVCEHRENGPNICTAWTPT